MMLNKKLIIGIAVILLLTFGVVTTLFVMNQSKPVAEQTPAPTSNASISIENFAAYPELDITLQASIEEAMNGFVQEIAPNTDAKGTIRASSYTSTPNEVGKNIVFLVDFESIKLTYKVDLGLGSTDEEQIVYIVCPSENELLYPPFKCKDSLSV